MLKGRHVCSVMRWRQRRIVPGLPLGPLILTTYLYSSFYVTSALSGCARHSCTGPGGEG